MKKHTIGLLERILGATMMLLGGFSLSGSTLNPGDIVYADSGNATVGGFVVKVDAVSGAQSVLSAGGSLVAPFDVAIDEDGQIIVSDSGRLIEIEPQSGRQKVLVNKPGVPLGSPFGIDIDSSGEIVTANARSVLRVDMISGEIGVVSSGQHLTCPLGVAVETKSALLVADAVPAQVVRVHSRNGSQKVVSQGGYLNRPQSIAVEGRDVYVTDVADADGNFGVGRVIHVDAHTGRQTIVAEGGFLVGPVGLAMGSNGNIIVGDPYTINPESGDRYDGAIISIDRSNGRQTLVARGTGNRVNPRGVAIVKAPIKKGAIEIQNSKPKS